MPMATTKTKTNTTVSITTTTTISKANVQLWLANMTTISNDWTTTTYALLLIVIISKCNGQHYMLIKSQAN